MSRRAISGLAILRNSIANWGQRRLRVDFVGLRVPRCADIHLALAWHYSAMENVFAHPTLPLEHAGTRWNT
jgi:hypothetical protein